MITTLSRAIWFSRRRPATDACVTSLHHHGRLSQLRNLFAPRVQVCGKILDAALVEDKFAGLFRIGDKGRAHTARPFFVPDHDLYGVFTSSLRARSCNSFIGTRRLSVVMFWNSWNGPSVLTRSVVALTNSCHLLPSEAETHEKVTRFACHAHEIKQVVQNRKAAAGIVIAGTVMTVAGMATAHDHTVSATLECFDDEKWVYPATAGQPDDAYIGIHLQTAGTSQVGPGVGTPVTDESYNFGRPYTVAVLVPRSTSSVMTSLVKSNHYSQSPSPDRAAATISARLFCRVVCGCFESTAGL